jgi:benzoyl-CoA 2,3-dioxygenase component B
VYAGQAYDVAGNRISAEEFEAGRSTWLPTARDKAWVSNLMAPTPEPGQMAHWIAPPARGINGKPIEFEYIRRA